MKRKLVALVGLVLVSSLMLFPVAVRGAEGLSTPASIVVQGRMDGWDWGGSGGS